MNGLYLQLHAYMLRVAIPYGTLNSTQMHRLADDRGQVGQGLRPLHHTPEYPVQLARNCRDVPDMLDALGGCRHARHPDLGQHDPQRHRRPFRGRRGRRDRRSRAPYRRTVMRQWSTDHPEFQFLPRKFKIAVTGSPNDRAVTKAHDIGLRMVRNDAGEPGFRSDRWRRAWSYADGRQGFAGIPAQGRPAALCRSDPVSVYNLLGRRDNKYKARIKITGS